MQTVTLWRPVGPAELDLIAASEWRRFPPRLPHQPIFYPVCNEEYARQITEKWNVPDHGVGYVTKFEVLAEFCAKYPVRTVGAAVHQEYWIPAEDLEAFNRAIVGLIEVVAEYRA
ncbi:MAG: hypothetical protein HYY18_21225 [Planctomycetes bacterium]|nr:hypothetical protein [Planctomycetota bacterium]